MRKIIKSIALFSLFFFLSCGGGSIKNLKIVNEAPTKVDLVYPTQNLLCIDNTISFDWSDATDANNDKVSYKIEFSDTREMANITNTETASTSKKAITLSKGVAYYWRVTAIDSKDELGEASLVNAFYTKGTGETNTAPFTAEIVSPENEVSLVAGTVSVDLKWKGADSNTNDVLNYEVYFGETTDLTLLEDDVAVLEKNVTVESGKTYYWKINTIDNSGAKSIGQVWSFSVN
ncbi:hypothetical protein CXF68_04360 [Tenacibaculum sp. Bg11-29]|uniref:hypothetical protein n=1 Tax=Tenacibaculum sp. Bg11-29 TaxID=2058306 RepID=UPI000C335BB7|nr:hypothetical protein [Tenacibaculum sp. Bg11-29]PKH49981.1 hypothetical protein CXF68_04360 [Tenacibaculum sp. Bg11-29]